MRKSSFKGYKLTVANNTGSDRLLLVIVDRENKVCHTKVGATNETAAQLLRQGHHFVAARTNKRRRF